MLRGAGVSSWSFPQTCLIKELFLLSLHLPSSWGNRTPLAPHTIRLHGSSMRREL